MTDFINQDLAGSVFADVYLTGARFHDVDLTGADFRLVDLTGATIRGAALVDVDISGEISGLRVNGVDVAPLVEAELDRRYPDRAKMRPADADGFREAWDILDRLWQRTVARARGMDPELLHERVEGEGGAIGLFGPRHVTNLSEPDAQQPVGFGKAWGHGDQDAQRRHGLGAATFPQETAGGLQPRELLIGGDSLDWRDGHGPGSLQSAS